MVGATARRAHRTTKAYFAGASAARAPDRGYYAIPHGSAKEASPHVNGRAACRIGLGLAQHLVRHRRDVPLAEQDVLGQELERVALGPIEVDVRALAGRVAQVE